MVGGLQVIGTNLSGDGEFENLAGRPPRNRVKGQ
jgi:hypothetical protein